ncbi:hypothetical protein TNCV_3326361 [Trichonephila clavipes]|nr:hypothetical protein TNCV_3326361 [Trichonephila clavipes]
MKEDWNGGQRIECLHIDPCRPIADALLVCLHDFGLRFFETAEIHQLCHSHFLLPRPPIRMHDFYSGNTTSSAQYIQYGTDIIGHHWYIIWTSLPNDVQRPSGENKSTE